LKEKMGRERKNEEQGVEKKSKADYGYAAKERGRRGPRKKSAPKNLLPHRRDSEAETLLKQYQPKESFFTCRKRGNAYC
jgi:hypothetical protein